MSSWRPPPTMAPQWEAGDLFQVLPPGEATRPRDYSIASLPAEGSVHLLVRQERRADGSIGSLGLAHRTGRAGSTILARFACTRTSGSATIPPGRSS